MWPDNWDAFLLFCSLQTQWRAGPNGVIGLDYNVLYHVLDRKRLSTADYDALAADVQVLELAALNQMQENREQAA